MRRITLTFVGLICYCLALTAQITITGKVTGSDDGLPLPQVTVLEKGTTNGVPTNANGEYAITVADDKTVLVFRYLGYVTKEIIIGNRKVVNIQLQPDAQSLGEVVVAAYGSSRRSYLYGSVSGVSRSRNKRKPKRRKPANSESYAKINESGFHRLT